MPDLERMVQLTIDFVIQITYNMLNKGAGKIDEAYPFRRNKFTVTKITVRLF